MRAMPILKEYVCAAHGPFEAFEPECEYGCSPRFVRQEFRTAPGYKSERTSNSDKTIDSLAKDYGMTNMSNRDGESVMQRMRREPQTRPTWGQVAHAAPGFSNGGKPLTFNPASMGVQAENVLGSVQPMLSKPKPMFVGKPRD
jgi:hypothetical protein